MMSHHAPTAAVAAFLAIACLEGFAVFLWRWMGDANLIAHRPPPQGAERLIQRRALFFWLGMAVLFEGAHDLMRASYHVLRLDVWPQWLSFWLTAFESAAVLGLIRTFTVRACGEWGWTIAATLPLAAAMGVLFR